jgi:hypothetical protein
VNIPDIHWPNAFLLKYNIYVKDDIREMVKNKSNITWAAGFGNRSPNSINQIKRPRKRYKAQHDVEKHLNETVEHTSGVERLYRLARCLLEKTSS